MRKLLFLMLSGMAFCQQKINFEFDANLKDATKSIGSVQLMDGRSSKSPMEIKYKDETYSFDIAPDASAQLSSKFDKDNKQKGTRNIVFLLEDLSVFENNLGKKTVAAAHFRATSFEKKGDSYYYLATADKNVGTPDMQSSMTPKYLPAFFKWDISDLLKKSAAAKASSVAISQNDLPSYFSILSAGLPAFNSAVKDGVYENAAAFFNNNPAEGYKIERNNDGKVQRAKNGSEKIPGYKIWAYVENGKIFKNTYSGFLPVEKNEKGFYIYSNRGELEMVPTNSTYGMFGLVGGIAGAVAQDIKQDKAKKAEKKNIYIDPLTGSYIF